METTAHMAEDWQPNTTVIVLWSVLGPALSLLGVFSFVVLYGLAHGGEAGFELEGLWMILLVPIAVLIFIALLPLHEWLYGLAMSRYGARPTYGAGVYKGIMPYLYCTAPGYEFTRSQFAVVSAVPLVVISLIGALCAAFVPYGGWLVVPVGAHLGGCIGDIWFLGVLANLPRGTILEDLTTGVRILRPTG